MEDRTKQYDYERLVQEELKHFSELEHTEQLTMGGAAAMSPWNYYWERVGAALSAVPYGSVPGYLDGHVAQPGETLNILSLGSGYCGHEIELSRNIKTPHQTTCVDFNEALFAEAKERTAAEGLDFKFEVQDLNFIEIEPGKWHLIFINAAVHHVINVEHLLHQVAVGLAPRGIFNLSEVVGQNRRLIWDENEQFANALLDTLPPEIHQGVRLDTEDEEEGMEGIRQDAILPALEAYFEPVFELRHGAFMRYILIHENLARALDAENPKTRPYLDFLIECDESAVRNGVLRPLELWGVYKAKK